MACRSRERTIRERSDTVKVQQEDAQQRSMSRLSTLFRGGIRPSFSISVVGPVQNSSLPSIAILPLLQHAGTSGVPLVSVGDAVREGMVVARAVGPFSAAVHSPIPGTVTAVSDILLPNGSTCPAIHIRLEGEFDRLGKTAPPPVEGPWTADEALKRLAEKGVVELRTSGAPLHALWRRPKGRKGVHLVVSAVRMEPGLIVDEILVEERAEAIVKGLMIARDILHPSTVSLAVSKNPERPDDDIGTRLVTASAEAGIQLSLLRLDERYPSGGDRAIEAATLGSTARNGHGEHSVIVTGASTLIAVANAMRHDLPLIERQVVVAGGAIAEPAVLSVRIGTRIGDLVEECGGFRRPPARIIVGGPMTGTIVRDLSTPVTKVTDAVLALTRDECEEGRTAPCIGCGRCVDACPEGLVPSQLFKYVRHGALEAASRAGISSCTECGCCGFVCPSFLPIVQTLHLGKVQLRHAGEQE